MSGVKESDDATEQFSGCPSCFFALDQTDAGLECPGCGAKFGVSA